MNFSSVASPIFWGFGFQSAIEKEDQSPPSSETDIFSTKHLSQSLQIQLAFSLGEKAIKLANPNFSISGKIRAIWELTPVVLLFLSHGKSEDHFLKRAYHFVGRATHHLAPVARLISVASAVAITVSGNYVFGGIFLTFVGLAYLDKKKILPLSLKKVECYGVMATGLVAGLLSTSMVAKVVSLFAFALATLSYFKPYDEKVSPLAEKELMTSLSKQERPQLLKAESISTIDRSELSVNTDHYRFRKIPSYFLLEKPAPKSPAFISKLKELTLKTFNVQKCTAEEHPRIFKIQARLEFLSQLEKELEKNCLALFPMLFLEPLFFEKLLSAPCHFNFEKEFKHFWLTIDTLSTNPPKGDYNEFYQKKDGGTSYQSDGEMFRDLWNKFRDNNAWKFFYEGSLLEATLVKKIKILQAWSKQISEDIASLIKNDEKTSFSDLMSLLPSAKFQLQNYLEEINTKWNEFKNHGPDNIEVITQLYVLRALQKGREKIIRKVMKASVPFAPTSSKPFTFSIFGKEYGLEPKEINSSVDYVNSSIYFYTLKSAFNFTAHDQVFWVLKAILKGNIPFAIIQRWGEKRFAQDKKYENLWKQVSHEYTMQNLILPNSADRRLDDLFWVTQVCRIENSSLYDFVQLMLLDMKILEKSEKKL